VEVREELMGPVVELLGKRRGQMFNMENAGYVNCVSFSYSFLCQFVNTFSLDIKSVSACQQLILIGA